MKIMASDICNSSCANIYYNKSISKPQKPNSTRLIAFRAGANKNQIAVITPECYPYTYTGGVSAVVSQRTTALKKTYPNKDVRVFLPFYNPKDKKYYSSTGIYDKNTKMPLKYNTESTGITADVEYGVKKTRAELLKLKDSSNAFPVYLIYAPEFEGTFSKEYDKSTNTPFWKNYNIFCKALIKFLDKMKDSQEKFNPALLHAIDASSSFAIKENSPIPSLYEVTDAHRSSDSYIPPFAAMLNVFTKEQINRIKDDEKFQKLFSQLVSNNSEIYNINDNPDEITNQIKNNDKYYQSLLVNTADNYENMSEMYKNRVLINEINKIVMKHTKNEIYYDSDIEYSTLITALKNCDNWIVPSQDYFKKVITTPDYCAGQFNSMAVLRMQNGFGVMNGINEKAYNPQNPNQVEYTYNAATIEKGKRKNKEFLFKQFSKQNIEDKNYDSKTINGTNPTIYGYLDKKNIDNPLVVNISRYDTELKGQDIAVQAIENILKNTNANVITAMSAFSRIDNKAMKKFVENVVNKPENRGRVVFIDNFVPVNEYFAGADFSLIASRSESCGLIGFQSMRMGAIPVATPVGAMPETIKGEEDIEKANGYLVPKSFCDNKNSTEIFINTLKKAIDDYNNNPELIKSMAINCMKFDSSWENSNKKLTEIYDKTINHEKLNKLSRNDIVPVEKQHNLSILTKDNIKDLPQSEVLVFLAHADDEIFFLPVLKYLKEGKNVQFIYGAKGDKGHYREDAPTSPDELALHRDIELCDALNEMGVKRSPLKLNYPDDELYLHKDEIENNFEKIINKVKPQVVFTFGPYGFTGHPDHKLVGKAALNVRNKYNAQTGEKTEIYQPVLTDKAAKYFKDTAIKNESDSFDFVTEGSVSNNDKSVKRIDMSEYSDIIEKSSKAHISQWSKKEVETFVDFYTHNPVEIQSLDKTEDNIDFVTNPWNKRNAKLSEQYGKEFISIFDGVKMINIEKGVELDLYLSKIHNKHDDTRLWIDSRFFDEEESRKPILDIISSSLEKIKGIKDFKNIKSIEFFFNDNIKKQDTIYTIPIDELNYFKENSDLAYSNCHKFIKDTKELNPNSGISLRY